MTPALALDILALESRGDRIRWEQMFTFSTEAGPSLYGAPSGGRRPTARGSRRARGPWLHTSPPGAAAWLCVWVQTSVEGREGISLTARPLRGRHRRRAAATRGPRSAPLPDSGRRQTHTQAVGLSAGSGRRRQPWPALFGSARSGQLLACACVVCDPNGRIAGQDEGRVSLEFLPPPVIVWPRTRKFTSLQSVPRSIGSQTLSPGWSGSTQRGTSK